LSFWHAFQLELGYDGAVIEVSTDGGATWSDLGPSIRRGGYVDVVSGNPLGDRMAWTGQRSSAMSEVEVDLTAWAGPGRTFRFRIASDASSVDGFGWFIDDIEVCQRVQQARDDPGPARSLLLGTCSRSRGHGPPGRGDRHREGVEHDPCPNSPSLAEGTRAGSGRKCDSRTWRAVSSYRTAMAVKVECTDEDDGSGDGASTVSATAGVDCGAPQISGVRLLELWDDQVTIAWGP
jgi:hypothetical protein